MRKFPSKVTNLNIILNLDQIFNKIRHGIDFDYDKIPFSYSSPIGANIFYRYMQNNITMEYCNNSVIHDLFKIFEVITSCKIVPKSSSILQNISQEDQNHKKIIYNLFIYYQSILENDSRFSGDRFYRIFLFPITKHAKYLSFRLDNLIPYNKNIPECT